MEIIELKNLITEINKNKHKSCWICSKVEWRQGEILSKLKTLIELQNLNKGGKIDWEISGQEPLVPFFFLKLVLIPLEAQSYVTFFLVNLPL